MGNEIIEALDSSDDAEFQELVNHLLDEHPKVESKGFDLTKVQGRPGSRSWKAVILHLTLCGWPVSQIADALGSTPHKVSAALAVAIQEAVPVDDVEILRSLEIQKLGAWEQKANELLHKSTEPTVTKQFRETEDGRELETRTIAESRANPIYIKILLEISKRRSALLGMDQPTKVVVDKTTKQLTVRQIVVTTPAEVAAAREQGLIP